jgi:hypothetical protein
LTTFFYLHTSSDIVMCVSDYGRVLDWQLDLPNTFRSSLQVTLALSLIHILCSSLQHVLSLLSLLCHQSLPGDRSHQCPLLPCLRYYQLATLPQITHTLLTAVSRLFSKSSWPSLYSFGMDRTKNTASKSSPIVAWVCCGHYLATALFTEPLLSNGCCIAA